ncbi:MAG: hypothetical protein H6581_17595 [Bacteroidia bacterium]|nr:hypothetical protein [Bacteroidia bacterium]
MKSVNKANLDEWIFEYLEGNLDGTDRTTLDAYLRAHPEAGAEFEAWKGSYLKPQPVALPAGISLQKAVLPGWAMGLSGIVLLTCLGLLLNSQLSNSSVAKDLKSNQGLVGMASNAFYLPENQESEKLQIPQKPIAHYFSPAQETFAPIITPPTEPIVNEELDSMGLTDKIVIEEAAGLKIHVSESNFPSLPPRNLISSLDPAKTSNEGRKNRHKNVACRAQMAGDPF